MPTNQLDSGAREGPDLTPILRDKPSCQPRLAGTARSGDATSMIGKSFLAGAKRRRRSFVASARAVVGRLGRARLASVASLGHGRARYLEAALPLSIRRAAR
jgi:hypothetical protein